MDSSSQDQSDSLILGNCLSCHGLVRVPSKAPSDSVVRCPHCSESYRLAQILDKAVPELEVIGEGSKEPELPMIEQINSKEREVFVVPPQLSKGAKRSSRRHSRSSAGSSDKSGSSRTSKTGVFANSARTSKGRSESSSDSRRRSKPSSSSRSAPVKRNPAAEMAKVIVGGLLAIPIAYLLVLWIFNQDPLGVGPKIGNVAPFMVPASFRQEVESDEADADSESAAGGKGSKDNSVAIPTLDPDRVLNPDLEESN